MGKRLLIIFFISVLAFTFKKYEAAIQGSGVLNASDIINLKSSNLVNTRFCFTKTNKNTVPEIMLYGKILNSINCYNSMCWSDCMSDMNFSFERLSYSNYKKTCGLISFSSAVAENVQNKYENIGCVSQSYISMFEKYYYYKTTDNTDVTKNFHHLDY